MHHDRSLDEEARQVAPPPAVRAPRWWLGLIGLWLAACVWLLASRTGAIATMTLPDSDDDLRLLQVRDWLHGQGWFDLRQYRLDPPAGADIHWSRLVDLPLAALIRPLTPLVGAGTAEMVAAAAVPLVTLLAAMALLAGIARRTIAPAAWWWAPLLLLMASPALDMMAPLRIDHHGWQIVTVLTALFGLVTPDRRRGGAAAGIAIAASLAIGVEMLPYLALGGAAAACGWVVDAREGERLRWLGATAAVGTVAALFLLIPPGVRFGMACDALSGVYALPLVIGCGALVAGTLWIAPNPGPDPGRSKPGRSILRQAQGERGIAGEAQRGAGARLAWVGAAALAAGASLLLAGGGVCLIDPYRAVDPVARALWLDRVSEALPLLSQTREVALASLALPVIGLAGAVFMLARTPPGARRPWLTVLAFGALSIALALVSTRAAVAAQALAVPGAAALGWCRRARLAASGSMLVRVFGSVALFLSVSAIAPRLLIAAVAGVPETKAETRATAGVAACMAPAALATLGALPAGTMLGFIDNTPALLLHTPHRGVAGPYHRNGRAIADTMRAWAGTPAEAQAIAARHGVDYVIACGDPAEAQLYDKRAPDGFHARLLRGDTPGWLVPLPIKNSPWRVWRVRRALPGRAPAA